MNEIDKYYQILGLKPGASEKEIVEAYKLLVKVWHPDRFSDEPNIQKNVTAKIKEIDEAFKQLLVWSDSIRAKRRETTEPKLEVRTEPSEAKGGIVIQSEPEDAVIVINEQPVGMGCYERRDLPIGSYKVWVIKEGYENWEKDVCVKAGAKQEVLAKLKLKETPQSRATHLMEAEAQIPSEDKEYGSPTPRQIEKKKKSSSFLRWFLWWQLDPAELDKQITGYQSLKITQSARGQSLLFLIFSASVTTIFILFSNWGGASFVEVIVSLLLGYFIYRGHQWAMIGAMIFWSLEKLYQSYEGLFSGSSSWVVHVIWWAFYMHAFYLAFNVERLRTQKRNEYQGG